MVIDCQNFKILNEYKGNRFNKIYLVEDISSKAKFVLKIIHIKNRTKEEQEIEIHKFLSHKYIIKLLDYDITETTITMLLEYAKYGDLYGYLRHLHVIQERKLINFYFKFVQSISYLHENGFVHRDIKPENILIAGKFTPKLADFGSSSNFSNIDNSFCGTYEYMAPETMAKKQQDCKVDIWALGILLYEMTHMITPFRNLTETEIITRVENDKIRFKNDFNGKIQDLIIKILKINPEKRPTTKEILEHELFDEFRFSETRMNESPQSVELECSSPEVSPERTYQKDTMVNNNLVISSFEVKSKINVGLRTFTQSDKKIIDSKTNNSPLTNSTENLAFILKNLRFDKIKNKNHEKRSLSNFMKNDKLKVEKTKNLPVSNNSIFSLKNIMNFHRKCFLSNENLIQKLEDEVNGYSNLLTENSSARKSHDSDKLLFSASENRNLKQGVGIAKTKSVQEFFDKQNRSKGFDKRGTSFLFSNETSDVNFDTK